MTWCACAALAAVAVALAIRPAGHPRVPGQLSSATSGDPGRLLLSLAAGGLGGVLLPGVAGAALALCVASIAWVVLGRRLPREELRRRRRIALELPVAVDLLAAALRAGADPGVALGMVIDALPGPATDELDVVAARLAMGGDPTAAWTGVAEHAQLAPLGRAVARAQRAGSSVAVAADRLAAELRDDERLAAEARAKAVSTRAAAPLGLCFLPAFVLLGIVPLVAGLVGQVGTA